jgi:hypothetical protein
MYKRSQDEGFQTVIGADQQLREAAALFDYENVNPINYELQSTWEPVSPNYSYLDKYQAAIPWQAAPADANTFGAIDNMLKYQKKFLIDQLYPRNYVARSDFNAVNPGAVDDLNIVDDLWNNRLLQY